ncbi:MAG: hypothetical protein LBD24_07115 [Spirochaetaceae bacterium]|nr:hypothetical protein [Spirochaetaceae bacterium]
MHHSETTGGHAEAVGDGPRLSGAGKVTGQGVAPFKKQQCLKQPEAGVSGNRAR